MTRTQRWRRTVIRLAVVWVILLIMLCYFAPLTLPHRVLGYTGTCVQLEAFVIGRQRSHDVLHGILTFADGRQFYLNTDMTRHLQKTNWDDALPAEQVTVLYTPRTSMHREGAQRTVGLTHADTEYVSLKRVRRSAVTFWAIFGSLYLIFAAVSILLTLDEDRTLFADRIKKNKKMRAKKKAARKAARQMTPK